VNKKEIKNKCVEGQAIGESSSTTDPYSMFLFAMRSPKTREKCTGRLRMFFDFIGIPEDSMEERYKMFCKRAKNNDQIVSEIE
jgi:hypothetical protein